MVKHHTTVEAENIVEVNISRKSSDELAEDVDYMPVGEVCVEENHGSDVKGLEDVASPDKANGSSNSSGKEEKANGSSNSSDDSSDDSSDEEDKANGSSNSSNDSSDEEDKANGSSNSSEEAVNKKVDSEIHVELLTLPPHGSEVFIYGLMHDATEEYVRELCEPFGKVFELKVVKNKDANRNNAHAFVTFTTKDAANNAIKEISSKGKELQCSLFQRRHKLFIGSIPKSLSEEELRKILEEISPGLENIDFFKISQHPSRNSCAFVEYYNEACAQYALQKLKCADFKLDGSTPSVSWADGYEISDDSDDSPAATEPIIIGIGRVPPGMRLVRIILPDDQLGYILQRKESPSRARALPWRRSNRSCHSSDNNNSYGDWSSGSRYYKRDRAINQSGCQRAESRSRALPLRRSNRSRHSSDNSDSESDSSSGRRYYKRDRAINKSRRHQYCPY